MTDLLKEYRTRTLEDDIAALERIVIDNALSWQRAKTDYEETPNDKTNYLLDTFGTLLHYNARSLANKRKDLFNLLNVKDYEPEPEF